MKATPFLMFQGEAKSALALYERVFPGYRTLEYQEFSGGDQHGQVMMARVSIGGQEIMINDSLPVHDFSFTPSSSIYIECDDAAQLRALADGLAAGGQVLMPLDNYGFSTIFAWVSDSFGVSWQLNLQ